jgi:nucleotide-binding universal stress UspA family protein
MPYQRILVPIDGSDTSNKALAAAIRFATEHGSKLRLVHKVDELAYVSGFEYSGDVLGMTRSAAQKILEDGQALVKAAGVEAETRVIEFPGQRLGETIAAEARECQADLIIVGTHGHRGLSRVLLGSGAEQIIRLAPVPVLVVRGD